MSEPMSGDSQQSDGWISVDDRMPAGNESVIVCATCDIDGMQIAIQAHRALGRRDKAWFSDMNPQPIERVPWPECSDNIEGMGLIVKAWMPLPGPQKNTREKSEMDKTCRNKVQDVAE